ncbi:hypothetical protein [Winogradskyella aquimaris]|uniref:DUF2116 family Zn-ribbon domain-containing protein n=1 Tax=Winogradskyella aquimaris TaxID=864074 RepID=A0ABU5EQ26_9FLAO|nr:hypothetical protein [Winogradskyella aquimaris]MDY2588353.1 hypothetical protein [Winogradskyella aquimaris]
MEISNCQCCNSEYEMRRSDQKFCSNKCRSRFNNKNRLRNKPVIKQTTETLLNDYRILLDILGVNIQTFVEKQKLRTLGFSGTRFTRMEYLNDIKRQALVIYDVAFYDYDENNFKLIKL